MSSGGLWYKQMKINDKFASTFQLHDNREIQTKDITQLCMPLAAEAIRGYSKKVFAVFWQPLRSCLKCSNKKYVQLILNLQSRPVV